MKKKNTITSIYTAVFLTITNYRFFFSGEGILTQKLPPKQ